MGLKLALRESYTAYHGQALVLVTFYHQCDRPNGSNSNPAECFDTRREPVSFHRVFITKSRYFTTFVSS